MNQPWTHAELEALLPVVKENLHRLEAEITEEDGAEIRAVPPSTREECLEYLSRLMQIAMTRPLERREITLHDQLLAQFEQAILAEQLGKKGRYYCIHEERILELAKNSARNN